MTSSKTPLAMTTPLCEWSKTWDPAHKDRLIALHPTECRCWVVLLSSAPAAGRSVALVLNFFQRLHLCWSAQLKATAPPLNVAVKEWSQDQRASFGHLTGPLTLWQGEQGQRLVELFVAHNHADTLHCYLSTTKTPVDLQGLLGMACAHGSTAVVRLLVGCRDLHGTTPNVQARDSHGRTVLHRAAHGGHMATVKCLLEAGATVDAKNANGMVTSSKIEHFPGAAERGEKVWGCNKKKSVLRLNRTAQL
jgi:hypothetical protein